MSTWDEVEYRHDNCIREMFSNMTQQRYYCECPCHNEGER